MLEPRYIRIIGYPKAWSANTRGEIIGIPMVIGDIYDLDSLKRYEGQLTDKIVMIDLNRQSAPNFKPFSQRFNENELRQAEEVLSPYPEKTLSSWESKQSLRERMVTWNTDDEKKHAIQQQLIKEAPAVLLEPSERQHGMVRVTESFFGNDQTIEPVPAFVIASEHFYRIKRMINKGISPTLKIQLNGQYFNEPEYNVNVIAEIAGSDNKLRSEVVMIGAHLDSWYAGTGATDNSANCAVLMEVMRIFKALDLKPRRTVRMTLWGGEELGYHGSRSFVEQHIGDLKSGKFKENHDKINIYLNLDNGAGKIRGIYLQGHEKMRSIFQSLFVPFNDWGVKTVTLQATSYTDHEIFDAMNIPAFQFIQDPINYMTVTHHTNMDVYEYVIEEDVRQNAVIIASMVYHLAMTDEVLSLKPINNESP
jgi:hypothetical protein